MIKFMNEDYSLTESLMGIAPFAIYFGISILMVALFAFIYKLFTPHDEMALIKSNNTAAAITYGGALIGFVLPLVKSMNQSANIADFMLWGFIAIVAQLVTYWLVKITLPKISDRINNDEKSAAIYLASCSICAGMLNASAMSY